MGRAPQLHKGMVNTKLCRKIYSNFTHVVARCFDSTGSTGFLDFEMKREMSAAPDWMVKNMQKERTCCNALECDAASAASNSANWKVEVGKTSLPSGPEVSYGIPFRWSASRCVFFFLCICRVHVCVCVCVCVCVLVPVESFEPRV